MNRKYHFSVFMLVFALLHSASGIADASVDEFIGKEYSSLRKALVLDGWTVDSSVKSSVFSEFPEIECGGGKDSICSAGFKKNNEYVAVVVSKKDKILVVTGSY